MSGRALDNVVLIARAGSMTPLRYASDAATMIAPRNTNIHTHVKGSNNDTVGLNATLAPSASGFAIIVIKPLSQSVIQYGNAANIMSITNVA
jgi:hypothetical protein